MACALGVAISSGGCSSTADSSTSPGTDNVGVAWAAGAQTAAVDGATWEIGVGQRWSLRGTELTETFDGSATQPSLAQLVERSAELVVTHRSEGPNGPLFRLRLQSPGISVRPSPGGWGAKLSRALEAVEFDVEFGAGRATVSMPSPPPKAAATDAWRFASTLALMLVPPPVGRPGLEEWSTAAELSIGDGSPFSLHIDKALRHVGSLPCARPPATCLAIVGQVRTSLGGEFSVGDTAGRASGTGTGTLQAQVNSGETLLDGIILSYDEEVMVDPATHGAAGAAKLRLHRRILASLSLAPEHPDDAEAP